MKKTIMVLGFALFATLAFAQTSMTAKKAQHVDVQRTNDIAVSDAGYKGSIFTKDGELYTCTFSAAEEASQAFTTGSIGAGVTIAGTNRQTYPAAEIESPEHTISGYPFTWHRIADTTMTTFSALFQAGNYPALVNYQWNTWGNAQTTYMNSATPMDGFMLMSLIDQYAGWGGTGATGNWDAYVAFPPVSTASAPLVRVEFYQYYRCFNYDRCYIDYSTDGTNWSALEINARNIDMSGNTNSRAWVRTTLPASCAGVSSLYVRIRWTESHNDGGYWWMIDDYALTVPPQNHLNIVEASYFEGFYGLMPQGLQVPVVWALELTNDGVNSQTNVTATVETRLPEATDFTALTNYNIGTMVPDAQTVVTLAIDPLNWYGNNGFGQNPSLPTPYAGTGSYACLPTENTGLAFYRGILTSDALADTFRTIPYEVNHTAQDARLGNHPSATWARDNGIVRKFSYYTVGMVGESVFSTEPDDVQWNQAGYGSSVSYVTGNNIPAGWRILGMEMVVATRNGMNAAGTQIEAVLRRDTVFIDPDDNETYLSQITVPTGASTYTVTNNDVITGNDFTNLTYSTFGNYNTVFIPFPEHPVLEPRKSYRVGYQLVEEAQFCAARWTQGFYYSLEDSTAVYFSDEPGMEAYTYTNGPDNYYSTYIVYDPYLGRGRFLNDGNAPMIRLIVGPDFFVEKRAINFECGENGEFEDAVTYASLCGEVDSCALGSTHSYYAVGEEGYEVDRIYLDGTDVTENEDYVTINIGSDGAAYALVTVANVQANHTLRCTFKPFVGIDKVTGISLNLQPNPATSNVHIAVKGATGMATYAIIDMSGRTVLSNSFNAEMGANVNVSGLAKGAYFVRISNDKFSKVEKLIVR
ncbi:MAG: T9SS type A sorting domain-containing protein [Bacteroidales bacterium]|nr:T9SS type A sorting domain-containing protein [Bacteroidales bacterium]